jgi:chemotaxis protein MotB
MEANGLRPEQVQQVRGYADRQLRHPDDPSNASNRRISVIVQYLDPKPGGPGEAAKGEAGQPPKGEAPKSEPSMGAPKK